eukprot:gene6529-8971_t
MTSKYRAVASNSSVDETLFGNYSGRPESFSNSKGSRKLVTGPITPSAVVINKSELERIRNESVIKSDAEIAADRERALLIKEEKEKLSRLRKEKMRELEKKATQLAKKSDFEVQEIAKAQAIRALAAEQIDNNSDVVKLLNSMAQRAAAFTIREKQLDEKHRLEKLDEEFEKRMDCLAEIERLKDIQRRELEETEKRTRRIEERKTITEQIESRQKAKLLELEAREQENNAMRNLMKKYEDEDSAAAAKRKILIEKSRLEVISANAAAIRIKKEARDREKKEVEDILIYQALKDAELAKREEEERALELLKKERQAKLLDQQERAQNNAGKLDELRARRATEEKERQARRKEKEEAIRRKEEVKELLESRAKQAADKLERAKLLKVQAEEEILNGLEYTRKMDEREDNERRMKKDRANLHRSALQQQIEEEALKKKMKDVEENNIRQEILREEAKLKVIRDKMVSTLEAQGVNPKYLSEMKNVDIGKMLKR